MGYPELIYLYIEDIGYCFKKQEFLFSRNYEVNYDKDGTRCLQIQRKENCLKDIYGKNIANINLIVGQNGSGKTTVMDLLALPQRQCNNRFKLSRVMSEQTKGWFAIYSLDVHDNEGITYYIEGYNVELISNLKSDNLSTRNFSCCVIMRSGELVRFKRGNIVNKLKIYYWPSARYPGKWGHNSNDGILKRLVKPADAGEFFEFICYRLKKFKDDISASNVEFVIKILNPERQEIAEEFTTRKEQFLLNVFKTDFIDLANEMISCTLPDDIRKLYLQEIERRNKEFVGKLEHYMVRKKIYPEKSKPFLIANEDVLNYHQIKKMAERRARRFAEFCLIPDRYFKSDSEIVLPAKEDEMFNGEARLLKRFSEYQKEEWSQFGKKVNVDEPSIKCEYRNISQGEEALFRLFSSIARELEREPSNQNVNTTKIIFFDEPDLSMHPEWGRRFLYDMMRLLKRIKNSGNVKYQLVVATHSPFMVSDVLKESVLCLNKKMGKEETQVTPSKYGMLSNIHDILNDSFYLNAPFGELGKFIFDNIMNRIQNMKEYSEEELSFIETAISQIGDELIRMHLEHMLEEKRIQLLQSSPQQRKKRIQQLEEELRVLKEV